MEGRNYLDALIQGLKKKKTVLDKIIEKNSAQKELLMAEEPSIDEWEALIQQKAEYIEELGRLDDGFQEVYTRVKDELSVNRANYKDEIVKMQELIADITDRSVQIQAQEIRNKDLAQSQFAKMKRKTRALRQNQRVANAYKQTMKRTNVVDPQFLDKNN